MSTPRILTLPPGAHRTTIPTPSGPIAALAAGPVGGAPDRHTAVLVPGFTGSKADFIALLGPLAQAGRRVYAIDLPGQYQSPGSDTLDAYSCAALGRAVAEVIAALEQGPVHLLGHSFGGLVTRETVLSTAVPLLSHALLGSGPSGVEGSRREDALRLIAALGPSPTREIVHRIWWEHLEDQYRASGLPEEIHVFMRERMLANHPLGLLRMAQEVTSAPDRTAELAAAGLPTLVLYGEDDDAWSPATQSAMAAVLNARCVVIPGAAHSPNVEAPEATAAALTAFWDQAESR